MVQKNLSTILFWMNVLKQFDRKVYMEVNQTYQL